MIGDVESPLDHHRGRCRRPQSGRGRPHLRGLTRLGVQARRPLPVRGRGGLRAALGRPKSSPRAVRPIRWSIASSNCDHSSTGTGLDAGPETIRWHLDHHDGIGVSRSTISRYLVKAGLVTPRPRRVPVRPTSASRPTSPTSAGSPTSPTTGWPGPGRWPGVHGRSCPGWTTTPARPCGSPPTGGSPGPSSWRRSAAVSPIHGIPVSTLTDNGMVFTTRLAGGRGGRNGLEIRAPRLGVHQKNSRPNHPTTCGKVERFQQTMKKWLRAQPAQPRPWTGSRPSRRASWTTTTPAGPTAHSPSPRRRQPPTWPVRRPARGPAHQVPTIGCVGTESTRPGRSPRVHGKLHHISVGDPHRNPRHHARPRTPRTGRPGRHRRATPDLHVKPDQGLSADGPPEGTRSAQEIVIREGSDVSYVSRDDTVPTAGIEPATPHLGNECSIP